MTPRTPNTFVIGAGPVATAQAGALRLAGVPVLGLWARRADGARLAGATSGVAAFSSAPPDLLLEANVVLVLVRDDAISDVAAMLVGTGLIGRSHILIHASGVLSAREAFASVEGKVRAVATMHPLRAIPDGAIAMRDLAGTVFGIEGDPAAVAVARDLVAAIGGEVLALDAEAMAAYHAAAAIASNYLVTLVDAAASLLSSAGVDREKAVASLAPLMRGTLENVVSRGTTDALTGPIRRGDAATIARHLSVVTAAGPAVSAAYRALGRLTVEIARRHGGSEGLDEIERLLRAADPGSVRNAG